MESARCAGTSRLGARVPRSRRRLRHAPGRRFRGRRRDSRAKHSTASSAPSGSTPGTGTARLRTARRRYTTESSHGENTGRQGPKTDSVARMVLSMAVYRVNRRRVTDALDAGNGPRLLGFRSSPRFVVRLRIQTQELPPSDMDSVGGVPIGGFPPRQWGSRAQTGKRKFPGPNVSSIRGQSERSQVYAVAIPSLPPRQGA